MNVKLLPSTAVIVCVPVNFEAPPKRPPIVRPAIVAESLVETPLSCITSPTSSPWFGENTTTSESSVTVLIGSFGNNLNGTSAFFKKANPSVFGKSATIISKVISFVWSDVHVLLFCDKNKEPSVGCFTILRDVEPILNFSTSEM